MERCAGMRRMKERAAIGWAARGIVCATDKERDGYDRDSRPQGTKIGREGSILLFTSQAPPHPGKLPLDMRRKGYLRSRNGLSFPHSWGARDEQLCGWLGWLARPSTVGARSSNSNYPPRTTSNPPHHGRNVTLMLGAYQGASRGWGRDGGEMPPIAVRYVGVAERQARNHWRIRWAGRLLPGTSSNRRGARARQTLAAWPDRIGPWHC